MSSFTKSAVLAAIAGAATVAAHGHVITVVADGQSYEGFDPTSAPYGPQPDSITWSNGATDNGYVLSSAMQDPDIICHLDATNAALTAPVAAGSDVAITWNQWPESHHGPIIDYIADCGGDCATVDKTTLKWVKIAEMGQLELGAGSGTVGKWAADLLIENGLSWTVTIPSSIKAGNYVLRHEVIALHEGGTEGKTQMYPQCINLEITGSGTDTPEGVVGTELYTSTDAGINYNIYNDESNPTYVIPGPALYTAGSSGSEPAPSSTAVAEPTGTASATATVEPTTTAAPTTTSVPTTTAAPTVTESAVASAEPTVSEPAAPTSSAAPSSSAVPTPQPSHGAGHNCPGTKKRRSNRRHARHIKNLY